jgi:uncharacterized membrane protein
MQPSDKDYSFSLFKPGSEYNKKNRNLILSLLAIWVIAIFGFQLLLLVIQKSTPEDTLIKFESVWDNVVSGNASSEGKEIYVNSLIAVAGKSSVNAESKLLLNKAITTAVFSMISDSNRILLSTYVEELHVTREKLVKASDSEYIQLQEQLKGTKASINAIANESTGKDPSNLKESILPYCLNPASVQLTSAELDVLHSDMKLYLTHNQSILTDAKFLGFPFHYFYTSEFLLILFVFLSLFYSIRVTQLQKKFSVKE